MPMARIVPRGFTGQLYLHYLNIWTAEELLSLTYFFDFVFCAMVDWLPMTHSVVKILIQVAGLVTTS